MSKLILQFVDDYDVLSALIDGPYNPPEINSEHDLEKFDAEYEDFREGLSALLCGLGKVDPYGKGDFSLGHRTGISRGIGLVVDSPAFFSKNFLEFIKSYIDGFLEDYVVVVSGEIEIGKDFYICVTKDKVAQCTADKQEFLDSFYDDGRR